MQGKATQGEKWVSSPRLSSDALRSLRIWSRVPWLLKNANCELQFRARCEWTLNANVSVSVKRLRLQCRMRSLAEMCTRTYEMCNEIAVQHLITVLESTLANLPISLAPRIVILKSAWHAFLFYVTLKICACACICTENGAIITSALVNKTLVLSSYEVCQQW